MPTSAILAVNDDDSIKKQQLIPDAVDQLDQAPKMMIRRQDSADDDFCDFRQAESLRIPKETVQGNLVMENGDIVGNSAPAKTPVNDNGGPAAEASLVTLQKRFVSPKDFELLKVIGMGAFGKVLQVRNRQSKQVLAMKVISKRLLRRKMGYVENVQAERNILTRVRHPFVVTMHCSFQSREKLFIIMDFLAGGELFLRLGREGIFLEKTAAFYLAEIILALDHLHTLGILHRDLKPENVLLGTDGHICLTDFGLAKDFSGEGGFQTEQDESRANTVCGTHEYMAPEMVARQGYGRPADYWSLGCLAFEMLSGRPPFESRQGAKDLFRKIMTERVKMPDGSTAAACRLLKGLLNRNVQSRWGAARGTMFEVGGVSGLKKAEFFSHIDWEKLEKKEIDPPDVFDVKDDADVCHFHEEFTGMALPRSVVEMTDGGFRPRRIDSNAFRGFSFIQEDFILPERQENEVQSYWESAEGDGESDSDRASSKLDTDEPLREPLQQDKPDKKKRPPRKRKKKKDGGASNATTPAVSVNNTPTPSENGDAGEKDPIVVPTVATTAPPVEPKEVEKAQVIPVDPPPKNQTVPEKATPPVIVPPSTPATPPKVVPPAGDVWQAAPGSKKKGAARRNGTPAVTGRPQALQQQTLPNARPTQSPWSKQQQLPHGTQQPLRPGQGAWSQPRGPQPVRPTLQGTAPRLSVDAPSFAPPSSDWRQHTMASPRQRRTVTQPSWPSLDPPLVAKPTTSNTLKGAWAARKK